MEQAAYLTWIIQRVIYHGVVFADSTESDDKDIDPVACFSEELRPRLVARCKNFEKISFYI